MDSAIRAVVCAIARVVLDALRLRGPAVEELDSIILHHTVPSGASVFVARSASLDE